MTEDRTKFPPDYSGQEIIGMGPRAFAWSYKDDLDPMVNPEQIGRRPPPERCHESKEACIAAAWVDSDARDYAKETPLDDVAASLCDCITREAAQRANKMSGQFGQHVFEQLKPMLGGTTAQNMEALLAMWLLGDLMREVVTTVMAKTGLPKRDVQ